MLYVVQITALLPVSGAMGDSIVNVNECGNLKQYRKRAVIGCVERITHYNPRT